jgi:hypothetical protein
MPLEVVLRETIVCTNCKGDGELYNPEYQEMEKAQNEWYHKHQPEPTPSERRDWENEYWLGRGYKANDNGFVAGAWDVKTCPECEGVGTEAGGKVVPLATLANMLTEAKQQEQKTTDRIVFDLSVSDYDMKPFLQLLMEARWKDRITLFNNHGKERNAYYLELLAKNPQDIFYFGCDWGNRERKEMDKKDLDALVAEFFGEQQEGGEQV